MMNAWQARVDRLRVLAIGGDAEASRALRRLADAVRAPAGSRTRRAHRRAFERISQRVLGGQR